MTPKDDRMTKEEVEGLMDWLDELHPHDQERKDFEPLCRSYLAVLDENEKLLRVVEAARSVPTEHDIEPSFCGQGLCANCALVTALDALEEDPQE